MHDHDEISATDILGTAAVTMQDMIRLGHGPGHEMEFVLKGVTGKQAGKSTITLGFQTSARAKRGMSIEAKQKEEAQQVRERKKESNNLLVVWTWRRCGKRRSSTRAHVLGENMRTHILGKNMGCISSGGTRTRTLGH